MHVLLCTSADVKGCLAVNLAYQLLSERGHRLSVVLSNDDPKTKGAQITSAKMHHEGGLWAQEVFPNLKDHVHRGEGAFRTWNELTALEDVEVVVLEKNKTINARSSMATVRALAPDLIFSARFLHILKAPILSVPRHGVLNMVSSHLKQCLGHMHLAHPPGIPGF